MALDLWPPALPPPFAFVDKDAARIGSINGIPVYPLEYAQRLDPARTSFVVSVFKLQAKALLAIASRFNGGNLLTVYDLFETYCPEVFSNGWSVTCDNSSVRRRAAAISRCLADQGSRDAFHAALSWRLDRSLLENYPVHPEGDKYKYDSFQQVDSATVSIIDCGSYDLSFPSGEISRGRAVLAVDCFEPDDTSYGRCQERASRFGTTSVALHKEALSDVPGPRRFIANGLLSARLAPSGFEDQSCITVEASTLDHALAGRGLACHEDDGSPLLLKVHVEGEELEVLRGGRTLIQSRRPVILLNISHNLTDLIDVPEFLMDLTGYKLYVRSHSLFGEGLTLTAVPT